MERGKSLEIVIEKRSYNCQHLPIDATFRIPKLEMSLSNNLCDEIANNLASILMLAYDKLGENIFNIPKNFNANNLREELVSRRSKHIPSAQAEYLKNNRPYWEERYTNSELLTMIDLIDVYLEFDLFIGNRGQDIVGKGLGDEWYAIFHNIRGELPEGYPYYEIYFETFIKNITHRKFSKIINRNVKEYFKRHPEAIGDFPNHVYEDVVFDYEIDLNPTKYMEHSAILYEERMKSKI